MTKRKKLAPLIFGGGALWLQTSCSMLPKVPFTDSLSKESLEPPPREEEQIEEVAEELTTEQKRLFEESDPYGGDASEGALANLPPLPSELELRVNYWISYFVEKDRARFQRFLDRGESYKPLVTKILKDHGLPEELFYLAMIESGFQTHAESHAKAVGIWQFIGATGRRYGLAVNRDFDERRDPIRATHAAAQYLKDLHNVFHSWYLAMAAYNAGEARVMGSIMRAKSRNFWQIVDKKALPSETMDYIPKFVAALTVGKNPEQYGFNRPTTSDYYSDFGVDVPGNTSLAEVARLAGVSLSEIKSLNPHLRGRHVPHMSRYKVWLPESGFHHIKPHLASMPMVRNSQADVAESIPAVREGRKKLTTRRVKKGNATVAAKAKNTRYRVRKGDSLDTISRRFQVSVAQLRNMNRINRNRIYAGQILIVGGDEAATATR